MEIEQTEAPAVAEQETIVEAPEAPAPSASPSEAFRKAFEADLDAPAPEIEDAEPVGEGPARGPDGKFVSKEPKPEGEEVAAEPEQAPKPKTEFSEPPARFSADAKAAWEKAPAQVQAEVHRAVREMEQGIETYKAQVEPIKPYLDMAQQSGTTLQDALQRYVNTENMLRSNPIQGLAEIGRNLGMTPQQMGQMLLGQAPGQPDQQTQYIQRLEQKISQLEQGVNGINQTFEQRQQAEIEAQINAFKADKPRWGELENEIARLLETGYADDLADAYEKADRLNPAAPQPAPAAPLAPAQTRKPPQSVTGSPNPGSNPANTRAPSKSPEEALKRAFGSL